MCKYEGKSRNNSGSLRATFRFRSSEKFWENVGDDCFASVLVLFAFYFIFGFTLFYFYLVGTPERQTS